MGIKFTHDLVRKGENGVLFVGLNQAIQADGNLINSTKVGTINGDPVLHYGHMRDAIKNVPQFAPTDLQMQSLKGYSNWDQRSEMVVAMPKNALNGGLLTKEYSSWCLHMPDGVKRSFDKEQSARIEKMVMENGLIYPVNITDLALTQTAIDAAHAKLEELTSDLQQQKVYFGMEN